MNIPNAETQKILKRKIRALHKLSYSYKEISEMLGVSKSMISYAVNGRGGLKRNKATLN